jgi:zinc protease
MINGNSMKIRKFTIISGFSLFLVLIFACKIPLPGRTDIYGGLGRDSDPVPFMKNVKTGILPSGLSYFILENPKPENRAFLTLAVKAGSVLETDDDQGLAHFVEHMAFNGTVRFPEAELISYLRSLGMRFGPEINAYTGYDQTVYGIEVPVEMNEKGHRFIPDTALAVIDDWSYAITFNPADVDNERAVIMEEYRSRLGANERIRRETLPVIFRGSPYADRRPIGLAEVIENAPASRLEEFYRKWYRADNMALIITGDFDAAELEASLEKHFSIPAPDKPTVRPQFDLPKPHKNNIETLILTDPELTSTRIDIYFKRSRAPVRGDLSYYREELIDALISRMLDLRFNEDALKPETPYISAGAGNARYGTSSRYYIMIARAKSGMAEQSLNELLEQKEALLRYGFTAAELKIAINSLLSDMQQLVWEKDTQESSTFIDYFTSFYLEGGNCPDYEWELDAMQRMLPLISMRDIDSVIKDHYKWDDVRVFIYAPEADIASLPSRERVQQMIQQSKKMRITPVKDKDVSSGFLDKEPAPGNIIHEAIDEETGALRWQLDNGALVILKETVNRNNEISLYSLARGGYTSVPVNENVSAYLAQEMISISGLGPFSRTELARKLSDKQVTASSWTSFYYRGFQGSANSGDLKYLFEMLYLCFTDPRIDSDAVQVMLDQKRTNLAQRSENPEMFFSDEITRTIYNGNPYFKPLELSDLPVVNIDQALAFIKRGLNPADYTFVFTGNLDIDFMRNHIKTYIASIPRKESWNNWLRPDFERPEKSKKIINKGKEEKSLVYLGWFNEMPFTEEASITAQILSEYLDITMTDEIREKLGGVYSISTGVSVSPVPAGELVMSVYFVCDPRRVQELSSAVIDILNQTAAYNSINAVNDDKFLKSVAALKKQWETSIQSNLYIAQSYANSTVLLNLPLSRLNKRPQYYDAVIPADIQIMCSKALARGPVEVILFPYTAGGD